jgi:uncharacterized protein YjgD (DUF1641 family)
MSSLLDVLKKVVTPENVNCIPIDFTQDFFTNEIINEFIYFCKKEKYGFMQLALLSYDIDCINYLLSNFKSCICFDLILLPYADGGLLLRIPELDEVVVLLPLLQWCAQNSYEILLIFLEAGIRVGGAEEAFKSIIERRLYTDLTEKVLEKMLQMGISLNCTPSPRCRERAKQLIEKYTRRDRCKRLVMKLLGFLRFKKTRYFSGLDPRLLKQMVVTPVWKTRYLECWDTTEVKKLKI